MARMTQNYIDYIKSEKWQKKRAQVFAYYGKCCYACKTTRGPIQCHHRSYAHFGNEFISEIIPLCRKCHYSVTKFHRKTRKNGLWNNTDYIVAQIRSGRLRPGA